MTQSPVKYEISLVTSDLRFAQQNCVYSSFFSANEVNGIGGVKLCDQYSLRLNSQAYEEMSTRLWNHNVVNAHVLTLCPSHEPHGGQWYVFIEALKLGEVQANALGLDVYFLNLIYLFIYLFLMTIAMFQWPGLSVTDLQK